MHIYLDNSIICSFIENNYGNWFIFGEHYLNKYYTTTKAYIDYYIKIYYQDINEHQFILTRYKDKNKRIRIRSLCKALSKEQIKNLIENILLEFLKIPLQKQLNYVT